MTTGRAFDAAELTAQISAISILNEPLRRALYAYVLSRPGAVGRDEAGKAVGITRELAAFHLDKLLEEGLVDVEYRRLSGKDGPGAGRPAKLYRASDRQLEISLPGRRYELAARLLAEAFSQQGTDPAEALDEVAHRFGEDLGAQAGRRLGRRPSDTRLLHTTCQVLRDHGFEPTLRLRLVDLDRLDRHDSRRHTLEERRERLGTGLGEGELRDRDHEEQGEHAHHGG